MGTSIEGRTGSWARSKMGNARWGCTVEEKPGGCFFSHEGLVVWMPWSVHSERLPQGSLETAYLEHMENIYSNVRDHPPIII